MVGVDRFPPGHDRGSSHGETRIIRQAYFEHPDYVPLLLRAYELWAELEESTGKKLYHEVGLLQVGPPTGAVVPGVLESARRHGLRVEALAASEVEHRFPGFAVPRGLEAVYEPRAGYLLVEDCVRALASGAVRRGAQLVTCESPAAWRREGNGFVVRAGGEELRAASLVVAPGAWASSTLGPGFPPLRPLRKPVFWFRTRSPVYRSAPCFLYELSGGVFYGFPDLGGQGLKTAEHSGGESVENPDEVDRKMRRTDLVRIRRFLARHLPLVSSELVKHSVCLYTMSPDEHFIVDEHPEHPGLWFAAGLSGHGFKMVGVLGEALADLALDGVTKLPVEFLGLGRAALRGRRPR